MNIYKYICMITTFFYFILIWLDGKSLWLDDRMEKPYKLSLIVPESCLNIPNPLLTMNICWNANLEASMEHFIDHSGMMLRAFTLYSFPLNGFGEWFYIFFVF